MYVADDGVAAIVDAFPQATAEPVRDGWEDRWREFHRPVSAGGLWIGPPWIDPPAGESAGVVVVDPGRAFGTGGHPTTRACIELLSRLERGSLLDAGCGSGVVAVAAVRLGFAPVRAVDLDEVAVEVAAATARLNDVSDRRLAGRRPARRRCPRATSRSRTSSSPSSSSCSSVSARGMVVTSGYLDSERPSAPGWDHVDRLELEGWAADVLAKRH